MSVWTIINRDWERYPFKKLNKVYALFIKCLGSGGGDFILLIIALLGICQSFTFQFWWRLNRGAGFTRILAKMMFYHYYRRWGLHIPASTKVGPGLIIWHPVAIVINPKTVIGKNCDIYHGVSIGESRGESAIIGDNVMIGPNVSIVGGVRIGNNVKIGAGTVVINDVPDNCTTVGNPNRIISRGTGR